MVSNPLRSCHTKFRRTMYTGAAPMTGLETSLSGLGAIHQGGGQRRRRLFKFWLVLLLLSCTCWMAASSFFPRKAHSYPQWQLSTGAVRCAQCHFSPGGGGLVNDYGRDSIGEEQSSFGGNGALFHGMTRLPRWLAMGGDFRGAFVSQDVQDPNGATQAVFPMQADLQARAAVSNFSLYLSGGARAQVRSNPDLVPDQNYQPTSTSRWISREHYVMWRQRAVGPYARVGRFYAPFGLRLAEHVLYVRRDLGFNQLEESYNLSGGQIGESYEIHLTVFAPDFLRHIGARTRGVAAYGERRFFDDRALIGLQGKWETDSDDTVTRLTGGVVGKAMVPNWKTLFLVEADVVEFTTGGGDSTQFVGLLGSTVFPLKGAMFTALVERRQTDLRVSDTATNGAALLLNWFPYAHCEAELMGRLQFPSGGQTAKTLLVQLHYIL